nr:MAG TPA: hypothetical protein [Bacteriophage sp.]
MIKIPAAPVVHGRAIDLQKIGQKNLLNFRRLSY